MNIGNNHKGNHKRWYIGRFKIERKYSIYKIKASVAVSALKKIQVNMITIKINIRFMLRGI
jgi:3-dehydroquinate synthase class II